ncbi:hypothetical protein JY651_16610 [Pyxidicoccus parkwayensis]|uniref:Lipoprotein n=1 Tax=Pyxidicoccus parkwayensis TaxID=2813578 RepID=A0ABX7P7K7_9BACT|nr:hypothetical protein [Pyxidicoccus parkwaysis]QSQ26448.1 hypothetical protein JY651_16610 [Pyxidicoccus parkwaysis]
MTASRPRSVWLLALALMCACRASAPQPAPRLSETPLPEVFGPIGWSTTAADLRARFPEAEVSESEPSPMSGSSVADGGDALAVEVTATGAHLAPFGTVEIRVMGFVGHPAAVLVIQRTDNPGNECYPDGYTEEQKEACQDRLDRERSAVYDAVASRLIARYGPGKLGHLESEALLTEEDPVEPGQSERTWELPGLDLRLARGMDPRYHMPMMVRLVAVRDGSYHYW